MPFRIVASALAALMMLSCSTPGNAQSAGRPVAGELAFYQAAVFGPALQGDALYAVLDSVAGDFVVRLFPKVPGCLGAMAEARDSGGKEVRVQLNRRTGSERTYSLLVDGVDWAGVLTAQGADIRADWYHCQRQTHSLHTTQDGKHVLFKVAGQPMLAWSFAGK